MNYEEENTERKSNKPNWTNFFYKSQQNDDYEDQYEEIMEDEEETSKPVSIWTDVITLDTAMQIVDRLKNGEQQIVNFENTESDTERQIRYFLYGSSYALGGQIEPISDSSIIIVPNGITIDKPTSKTKKPSFTGGFKINN